MHEREGIKMYKVLIIDDDQDICEIVKTNIEFEGYEAIVLNEGSKAIQLLDSNKDIVLIVLDIMLPGESGLEILYKIKSNFNIPVFMLTALCSDVDKIKGLRGGAVDYITKPFNNEELRARISSMIKQLKGFPNTTEKIITKEQIVVDCNKKNVTYFNKQLKLTSTEYKIIEFLIATPGRIYTQQQIYENVTNGISILEENSIVVQICNIRKKFREIDYKFDYIETIYGLGYRWKN